MKNYLLLLTSSLLLVACNNKGSEPQTEEDSAYLPETRYSWQAVLNDSTGMLEMKKQDTAGPDSLTPGSVVDFINKNNPGVVLQLTGLSNDTVFLSIPDALYLTQQMGSTGPSMYFASAVYNLTEIPGIRFASFSFEEGDHAQPGTFSRESFINQ